MRNKVLKKSLSLFLILTIVISVSASVAAYSDVPANASYLSALNRLASLGIISSTTGNFNPDKSLTREQFAKMLVIAAGLEDTAASLKGSTIFSDVSPNSWSSGYINAAVNKGFITGKTDGKFHPADNITFAQMCTILVKALGYTDQDVTDLWPQNYIVKADSLSLTAGINLKSNDTVKRSTAVIMLDRLLNTYIKNDGSTGSKTFIETTGSYTKCLILGNSRTLSTLNDGQILTDKGIYYNSTGDSVELGTYNNVLIKNGTIVKASPQSDSAVKISVDQITENKINYIKNGTMASLVLPENITYYYQGAKQDYSKISSVITKNSSIVLNYDSSNNLESAVVFDPVYSKPEIANSSTSSSKVLGSINFYDNPVILKDSGSIQISQIANRDVVYQVTDIWGNNKYILVVDDKAGGEITAVKPNIISPNTIQINNIDYTFSKDFDFSKIAHSNDGTLSIGNNIVVLLDKDGKILYIENFNSNSDNNFAMVLDAGYTLSASSSNSQTYNYIVKLLFSDGYISNYNISFNAEDLKGTLVKYKFNSDKSIYIESVAYNYPTYTTINKYEHKFDSNYVSDNVKILNVIYNDTASEITASFINWTDLPNGTIPQGKILYKSTSGSFGDIDFVVTDDIFNQRYKTGVIKTIDIVSSGKTNSYSYTVLIDGKEYKFAKNMDLNASIGSVYEFKMNSSGIDSYCRILSPESGNIVQAIDSKRIKMNNKIYYLKNNAAVYFKNADGTISSKTLADIDITKSYSKVNVFLDLRSSSNNMIEAILITD